MKTLSYTGLALGALVLVPIMRPARPAAPFAPGFAVRYRNVVSANPVSVVTVRPGESVTFEVVDAVTGYEARPAAGRLEPLGAARWAWTAPLAPGLYPIHVTAPDRRDSVTLQTFVLVPYDRMRDGRLNGYRIGSYPAKVGPPAGFIEVTPENQDALVSPHFRLKQFLCKQPAGSLKYVVLNERLLLALEYVLERVNAAGYRATTFHVMSGYRTPAYNRSLGNVRNSQHQWGKAADIFIDENGDGRMDDLNGDGRSDITDAEVLYRLIDGAVASPEGRGLIGGVGKYAATAAHGPFVHVDVRPGRARW